jgi:hypothetical protein
MEEPKTLGFLAGGRTGGHTARCRRVGGRGGDAAYRAEIMRQVHVLGQSSALTPPIRAPKAQSLYSPGRRPGYPAPQISVRLEGAKLAG